jgi:hypothetical protein
MDLLGTKVAEQTVWWMFGPLKYRFDPLGYSSLRVIKSPPTWHNANPIWRPSTSRLLSVGSQFYGATLNHIFRTVFL